jgi:hypothetical protein
VGLRWIPERHSWWLCLLCFLCLWLAIAKALRDMVVLGLLDSGTVTLRIDGLCMARQRQVRARQAQGRGLRTVPSAPVLGGRGCNAVAGAALSLVT